MVKKLYGQHTCKNLDQDVIFILRCSVGQKCFWEVKYIEKDIWVVNFHSGTFFGIGIFRVYKSLETY